MVSIEDFRQGMASLTGAVNVITTDGPKGAAGITATAVCSVTDQPPTLLVCVNRNSYCHPFFVENGVLAVNVLRTSQQAVAQVFADRNLTTAERLARVAHSTLHTGSPVVDGTLVSFDCRVVAHNAVGSHDVLVCEVQALRQGDAGEGLVYFQRAYHGVGDAQAVA